MNWLPKYYRGLLIFCFAFEFGRCFDPALPCWNQKPPPAFQTVDWHGILDIFTSKDKGNRAMWKISEFKLILFMKTKVFSYLRSIFLIFKTEAKTSSSDHRTKEGHLEEEFWKFLKTYFCEFKMIVLMKDNVFSYFQSI